jgi:hypothetical protein
VSIDASATVAALLDDGVEGRWCEDQLLVGEFVAPHLRDLRHLDIELAPFDALADRAWELRSNLTIHDACYVATAELFRCRLITHDRKLAKTPGVQCEVVAAPQR